MEQRPASLLRRRLLLLRDATSQRSRGARARPRTTANASLVSRVGVVVRLRLSPRVADEPPGCVGRCLSATAAQVNLTTGENIWTLGGPDGMFAIRDEDNVESEHGNDIQADEIVPVEEANNDHQLEV